MKNFSNYYFNLKNFSYTNFINKNISHTSNVRIQEKRTLALIVCNNVNWPGTDSQPFDVTARG